MELRLAVEPEAGAPRDIVVELEPATPASQLLEELALHLGLVPGDVAAAQIERTGMWLAGDEPVGETGVRDGDRLLLSRARATGSRSPAHGPGGDGHVDLVVVGGPGSGTRIPLAPGRHLVGRGPGADVVLDDRSMSRKHFTVDVRHDTITVEDAGSSNGTFVDGRPVEAPRELDGSDTLEAGRTLIAFRPRGRAEAMAAGGSGRVAFNRPPRVLPRPVEARIGVPAPPAATDSPTLSMGAMVLPLVLGVAMYAVTGSPVMLMISVLSPAMAMWTFFESRRRGRRGQRKAADAFHHAVEEAAKELEAAREQERRVRLAAGPDAAELRARAEELRPGLWERRPADLDFLSLRVGTADLPSEVRAEIPSGGDAELRGQAQQRLAGDAVISGAPVLVALRAGLAGLAGEPRRRDGLARWLAIQAAILHSPSELRIAAAIGDAHVRDWDWLKWLPHVDAADLVTGARDGDALLERLSRPGGPATLVLLDGDLGLSRAQVAAAVEAGVSGLWIGTDARELPGACTYVLELAFDVARARVTDVVAGTTIEDVSADGVPSAYVEEVARRLAPIRDTAARRDAERLPTRVSLLELLGMPQPTAQTIEERWERSDLDLTACVGVSADGPFTIEAGQREGLRMLLAGMPGAGKSEFLQTLIASLAASHPPERLSFLLVDYKGGAAFQDCVDLPHTVGLLTDLDAQLAERCRISLIAELRRREHILKEAGARSLRDLARREPALAPPALVVVVDEFATLVREVPAFVETAVDVAQRGRSLGLHLVLATQRPRGAVSDTIRANTNLRVAMRVSDAGESQDVIEAPDAAYIPADLAGRAVVLAGRGPGGAPRLEEVQIAYAGGRSAQLGGSRGAVAVRDLRFGHAAESRPPVLSLVGGSALSDLQAIVAACGEAARRLDIPAAAAPWLPPLPAVVELDDLPGGSGGQAVLGLLDEPEHQRQRPYVLDLVRDGALLVYGASGSGKTSVLRTVAVALSRNSSPHDLQIYGLDFASRALSSLEALPHCGSIVAGDDDERVHRLLAALLRALAARRERLAAGGDLAGLPRVVLLVDGYAGFAAAYERVQYGEAVQALTRLAAEGRPLGVHVVITADRRADVPGSLSGVVGERVVLRMADDDDYVSLGLPRSAVAGAELPPGRGFTRDGTALQVARVSDAKLHEVARAAAEAHPGERAPAVGRLPVRVSRRHLPPAGRPWSAVVGLDDELLAPAIVDLSDDSLLVAGPRRSGRSTALATIARSLQDSTDVPVHLLAARRSPLTGLASWTSAAQGVGECAEAAERLSAAAAPMIVVVDDAEDLAEGQAAAPLATLLRLSRDHDIRLVAAVESRAAHRMFGGWVRDLRGAQHGLLLQPDDSDADLLGTRLPRRPATGPLPPGRGWLVAAATARLVQVAADGESSPSVQQ